MSFWRQLTRGLRTLWSRRAADQDTADEAQHFLEEAAAAHEAEGMAGDEARRAARLEAGNVALLQEQMRSYGWENALGAVLADLRFAARGLRKNAGFSAVAVSTLALGIGATTAIFSAVHPILFESLPYPHAERVAMVWYFGADGRRAAQSFGNFRELAVRNRTFEALAAMKTWQPTMMSSSEPDRLDGQFVSAAYFRALGMPPVLGRDFEESEDQAHGPRVAILSDRLWKRRFDADRAVIGKDVVLDGEHYQVVGVMPAEFENVLAPPAEIWTPLRYDVSLPADGPEWGHHLRVVGRFRAGIGKDTGRRDLNEIARQPIPEFSRRPGSSMQQGVIVDSLQDDVTRGVKPALLAIIGAVLLLLCIASVNVTNLLLARGAQRRAEFAMRIALGAGPARLIRQLLTESVLLALIGGALGLGVAELGVEALVALSPAELPRLAVIAVNGSAF
ncbi:MAG TPA: ABC transporter permease, partial [Methylomirabilota bacterium]|nr:ABC transporter permease [Methylomirabilota bacterium]